jgi:hypothetical protein
VTPLLTRLAVAVGLSAAVTGTVWAQIPPRAPDPQDLQEPRRAPLTITPTLTVTQEYNDNILLNNDDRRSDFITGFTPGITLNLERATYRLLAGYNFTAEVYWKEENAARNDAFSRHNFDLDGTWRVNPRLTLTLTDVFAFTTDTNLLAAEGVATGRTEAYANTLTGSAAYALTPLTILRGTASWTLLRFEEDELQDSDIYRVDGTVEHAFTPRVSGTAGYQFGYFDVEREERSTTHTPRVGVIVRATPTITLSLSGGPSIEVREERSTRIVPAVTAAYRQRFAFGGAALAYDRYIGTAGGLGGTTDNQTITGSLEFTRLMRGLTLAFTPRYATVESDDDRIDVRGFTIALQATYRINAWAAAVASYQFFQQRSDTVLLSPVGTSLANDVDQNRVFVGLQIGYPVRFD